MAAALTPGDRRALEQERSIFFRVVIVVCVFCVCVCVCVCRGRGGLGPSTPLSSLGSGD